MTPAQPYSFDSGWYSAALRHIAAARWKRQPLVVITGPPRAGKTTLCRHVADRNDTRTLVVQLATPAPTADAFLRQLACELGVLSKNSTTAVVVELVQLREIVRRSFANIAAIKGNCLVIVDEAHRLQRDALDEIRSLLGSWRDTRCTLQFLLVGQPQLQELIDRPATRFQAAPRTQATEARPQGSVAAAPAPGGGSSPIATRVNSAAAGISISPARAAITIAAVGISALLWYGLLYRPAAISTSARQSAADRPSRSGQQGLLGTNAGADTANSATPHGSTGVLTSAGSRWADEVTERAATLARQPDVEGLLLLRSEVETRQSRGTMDPERIESVLRRVNRSLDEARKRRLEIDRQMLLRAPSTQ